MMTRGERAAWSPGRRGYRAGVTMGIDVLLLSVDPGLRVVRERESTGYAMRAADLIELAVARRVGVRGGWVKWLHVLDARPTGEPLLDASLASLAATGKQLPEDWICEQPGVVNKGLALLEAQGAVRLYSRRLTSRLTLTEPVLLDPARQRRPSVHRVVQGRDRVEVLVR
jgi:hypothetical protein